jgi:multimeric flavodoxin WrbA
MNPEEIGKMKVVTVLGSPRKSSNSSLLAEIITDAAFRSGAETNIFHLNSMQIRGCQACGACKGKSERCILEDDLAGVLDAVASAHVVVLATPVYWGEVSGQMKLFIDRTYSYLKPGFQERPDKHRLPPGKKLVWIQSQGAEAVGLFDEIFTRYNIFFRQLQFFEEEYQIIGRGLGATGEVINRPELLEAAKEIGVKLFGKC